MSHQRAYGSAAAFRRALTDKLRDKAGSSPWTLSELQRQMAYDRLLERLYLVDERWVVKGATALLAREIGVRATIDIDVYRDSEREEAEEDLRRAASRDIGDWFRFEIAAGRATDAGAKGVRFPVSAYVGGAIWANFHVDLVGTDLRMTGQPEGVPALARVAMPNVEQHGYRAYPLVDHIADKVVATFDRYGTMETPSTRYKDLIDLVAIVTEVSVVAEQQKAAVRSEATRRGVFLPTRFVVPDRQLWEPGYAAEAGRSHLDTALTLDGALATVSPFLDPVLDGTAAGAWDPESGRWQTVKNGVCGGF